MCSKQTQMFTVNKRGKRKNREAPPKFGICIEASQTHSLPYIPQFQRTETPTQRYSPMAIVNGGIRIAMFEIQRIHDQCRRQTDAISYPQRWTVEICQEPFVGIGVEWVGKFNTLEVGEKNTEMKTKIHTSFLRSLEFPKFVGVLLTFKSGFNSGQINELPA